MFVLLCRSLTLLKDINHLYTPMSEGLYLLKDVNHLYLHPTVCWVTWSINVSVPISKCKVASVHRITVKMFGRHQMKYLTPLTTVLRFSLVHLSSSREVLNLCFGLFHHFPIVYWPINMVGSHPAVYTLVEFSIKIPSNTAYVVLIVDMISTYLFNYEGYMFRHTAIFRPTY
jgi:hypothetical protein